MQKTFCGFASKRFYRDQRELEAVMLSRANHPEQKGTTTSGKQTRLWYIVPAYGCVSAQSAKNCFAASNVYSVGSYVCELHHNDQCSTTVELLY